VIVEAERLVDDHDARARPRALIDGQEAAAFQL
jgi:hypothetical protein